MAESERDRQAAREKRRKAREQEWDAIIEAWNNPDIPTEVRDPESPFEPVEFYDKDGNRIDLTGE